MKRYLIFAALGPFLGGFFLLIATTVMSGYWNQPTWSAVTKLFVVFLKTLQYSYLFGILPLLMIAAIDDIVFHVKRIVPVLRMVIVGLIAFVAAAFLYGSRGSDSGALQFFLYGLVGLVPAAVCSWLAHEAIDFNQPAVAG
jgi:phosphoglycerol transferase MdoB-like AlkP superfamily enzyme